MWMLNNPNNFKFNKPNGFNVDDGFMATGQSVVAVSWWGFPGGSNVPNLISVEHPGYRQVFSGAPESPHTSIWFESRQTPIWQVGWSEVVTTAATTMNCLVTSLTPHASRNKLRGLWTFSNASLPQNTQHAPICLVELCEVVYVISWTLTQSICKRARTCLALWEQIGPSGFFRPWPLKYEINKHQFHSFKCVCFWIFVKTITFYYNIMVVHIENLFFLIYTEWYQVTGIKVIHSLWYLALKPQLMYYSSKMIQ